jgi:hypothetical protein
MHGPMNVKFKHRYPLNRRLCGRQIRSKCFAVEKSLAHTGIRTLDHPVRSLVTIPTEDGVTMNEDKRRGDQKPCPLAHPPQFRSVSKRITLVLCAGPTNKDVSRESASCIQMRIRIQADNRMSHTVIHNTSSLSQPYTQSKSGVLLFLVHLLGVLYAQPFLQVKCRCVTCTFEN